MSWGQPPQGARSPRPRRRPVQRPGVTHGWEWLSQHRQGARRVITCRVMMSCRQKGSSVSRSRKFLALIFSCSTAYSRKATVTVPPAACSPEPPGAGKGKGGDQSAPSAGRALPRPQAGPCYLAPNQPPISTQSQPMTPEPQGAKLQGWA